MQRREFIKMASGLCGVLMLQSGCGTMRNTSQNLGKNRGKQPNVIFIMTDDLGIGKVPCYNMGPKLVRMPNVDKLAAGGIRFTNAYSGNAVCGPSRASLISGLHPGHCGIRANTGRSELRAKFEDTNEWPPPKGTTLGEVAQQAGYKTACFGKIGAGTVVTLDEMASQGWDYWIGFLDHINAYHYYPPFVWENGKKMMIQENNTPEMLEFFKNKRGNKGEVPEKKGTYSEDFFADKLLDFIRTNKDQPFFTYFGSQVPHGGPPGMAVPDNEGYENDSRLNFDEQVYAAAITRHDKSVGRIIALLEELDIAKNTIVIWTSDNGDEDSYYYGTDTFDGNGPFRGMKRELYEGGIRVPAIAYCPGHINGGQLSDLPWASWDLLATIADIGNVPVPAKADGISILPTLMNKPQFQKKREYLYWEFYEKGKQQAVRMGKWKAYRIGGTSKNIELYDLSKDIGEKDDLASKYPDLVKRMNDIMNKEHTTHSYWKMPGLD